MLSRFSRGRKGFTVIELAIVMVVSGLVMGMGFSTYRTYLQHQRATESYDKQKLLATSISNYSSRQGRLPCPAVPNLDLTDQDAGKELPSNVCDDLKILHPVGTCVDFAGNIVASGGVCKIDGARDTAADPETVNNDPVLVGTVPFVSIKAGSGMSRGWSFSSGTTGTQECFSTIDGLAAWCDADSDGKLDANVRAPAITSSFSDAVVQSVLDPWSYQMSYAVTASLTGGNFKSANGAIAVQTEDGESLVKPDGSAHYVIVSHGDNHAGAYNAQGQRTYPCLVGAYETENCDGDAVFMAGLRSVGTTVAGQAEYFDDLVWHSVVNLTKLWDFANDVDIFNLNIGNVGVGTLTPEEKLHVIGEIKASAVTQQQVCGVAGDRCWSPDVLASPTGTVCDTATYPPAAGKERVVIGIVGGQVKCTTSPADPAYDGNPASPTYNADLNAPVPAVDQYCPPGQYGVGFTTAGVLLCQ